MTRPWRKPRVTPDDDQKYREFAGLINTLSEKDIGLRGLTVANNLLISDTKKLRVRPGKALFRAGSMQTAFVAGNSLYVVDGGTLQRVVSDADAHTILAGLTGGSYCWTEVNGNAYFVNGVEAGIVSGDRFLPLRTPAPTIVGVAASDSGALPNTAFNLGADYQSATWRFCATYEMQDGRETAPSDVAQCVASPATRLFAVTLPALPADVVRANVYCAEPDGTVFRLAAGTTQPVVTVAPARATRELTTYGTFPLPEGVEQIAYFEGKLFVSQYLASENQSVIWFSRPFDFHLYEMGTDYIVVPGRVALLLWMQKEVYSKVHNWLLIGSTERVWQYTSDGGLEELAGYGVVPGTAGVTDADGTAYFWTVRGFCKAPPFENLTEKNVGMPPGLRANTALLYLDGMQQLVTITQGGGTPFNVRN